MASINLEIVGYTLRVSENSVCCVLCMGLEVCACGFVSAWLMSVGVLGDMDVFP